MAFTEPPKLALGYTRVSTEAQADKTSPEVQEQHIRTWCHLHGFQLVKIYHEVKSGKNVEARPRFKTCVEYARQLKAALVVYDLTRASRSLPDALELAERLREKRAHLVSIKEGTIDTTSLNGELQFRMLMMLGDFQRKMTIQKTKEALAYKRKQGKRWCCNAPYGYQWIGDDLYEEPEEQRILDLIRAWAVKYEYKGCRVARMLNGRGLTARNGKKWSTANADEKVKNLLAGTAKQPSAHKMERLRAYTVDLKSDGPIVTIVQGPKMANGWFRSKHKPPKKYHYPHKTKYGNKAEYAAWRQLVSHPCLVFNSPEETPEGFRNRTPEEMLTARRGTKYMSEKPRLRAPRDVVKEEQFEEMNEVTRQAVEVLLGQNAPSQMQVATWAAAIEEPESEKISALPWQTNV